MADGTESLLKGISNIPFLILQAEDGDYPSVKQLLHETSALLNEGTPLPPDLANWIGRGLKNLAEGGNEKSAFGLRKPRGKPSAYSEEFERLVADSIHYSKLGRHKGISKDGANQGAYIEAAGFFGIAENTAEKFYKKHLESILMEEQIRQENANEESNY